MKKLVLAVAVLVFSTNSFAACTKNDLTGVWMISSTGEICKINVLSNGLLKADSSCKTRYSQDDTTASGKLIIDSTCHVKGEIFIGDSSIGHDIDGYISKGKDTITGQKKWMGEPNLIAGSKL